MNPEISKVGQSETLRNEGQRRCPLTDNIYDAQSTIIEECLPIFVHRKGDQTHTVLPFGKYDLAAYIARDLDVKRLNDIHGYMWLCGRPMNARALHRQKMMKRKILITEQADLHLLYHDDTIFVKPLPPYLLSPPMWNEHINQNADLHMDACGFLLSYVWLLRTPYDFQLAKDENLLPPDLKWLQWRDLALQILSAIDGTSLNQVNRRYHFGELRLHRINSIYRMTPRLAYRHFVRGYLYGYNRYTAFFQRSVKWLLVVFIWFSLALSAMQVGTSLPNLRNKQAFISTCLGFVVFSILLVAILVAFIGALFAMIFFYNMVAAICHARNQRRRRLKHKAEFAA